MMRTYIQRIHQDSCMEITFVRQRIYLNIDFDVILGILIEIQDIRISEMKKLGRVLETITVNAR